MFGLGLGNLKMWFFFGYKKLVLELIWLNCLARLDYPTTGSGDNCDHLLNAHGFLYYK